jgi:hypothetical protein
MRVERIMNKQEVYVTYLSLMDILFYLEKRNFYNSKQEAKDALEVYQLREKGFKIYKVTVEECQG